MNGMIANESPQCSSLRTAAVEIEPFDQGFGDRHFRVRTGAGRQYLLSELVAKLLQAVDGRRNAAEIASALVRQDLPVTAEQVDRIIQEQLLPRKLVESVSAPCDAPERPTRKPKIGLDFVLRVPLFTQQQVAPFAQPLTNLFRQSVIHVCLFLGVLAHLVFYGTMLYDTPSAVSFGARALSMGASTAKEIALAYVFAIATVLFHELGHAAACRRYKCEHSEIGFCLYLIFPAFYVDLSRAWGLPRFQRAVIDVGGIYFQFLAVVPLVILNMIYPHPSLITAIYAADIMIVFSLNPLFKCDGYWLLVDASGLANLQPRALKLLKETLLWPFRRQRPSLRADLSWPHKALLLGYSAAIGSLLACAIPYFYWIVPLKAHEIMLSFSALPDAAQSGYSAVLVQVAKLLGAFLIFVFLFRMSAGMLSAIFGRRKRGATAVR